MDLKKDEIVFVNSKFLFQSEWWCEVTNNNGSGFIPISYLQFFSKINRKQLPVAVSTEIDKINVNLINHDDHFKKEIYFSEKTILFTRRSKLYKFITKIFFHFCWIEYVSLIIKDKFNLHSTHWTPKSINIIYTFWCDNALL